MKVKWANDGALQANDGKILVNDGEMPVNDGEMSVWSYTHFTIIDEHFTIIKKHFTIINEHFTIIPSFDHHWEAAPTAICISRIVWKGQLINLTILHFLELKRWLCISRKYNFVISFYVVHYTNTLTRKIRKTISYSMIIHEEKGASFIWNIGILAKLFMN